MIASGDLLSKLEDWYQSQCNGDWEHQYGVRIDCLDNPGWVLRVDLKGTDIEGTSMLPLIVDNGDNDWMYCEVKDAQFVACGDPKKLKSIIKTFLNFAG